MFFIPFLTLLFFFRNFHLFNYFIPHTLEVKKKPDHYYMISYLYPNIFIQQNGWISSFLPLSRSPALVETTDP